MYDISNTDIDTIRRLLEAFSDIMDDEEAQEPMPQAPKPEGRRARDTRNLARMSRLILRKLSKKSPRGEERGYQAVARVEGGGMDISELVQAAAMLPDGTYGVELTRIRNPRTAMQNRYLWAVVYPHVLQGLRDAGWDDFTSTDEVHEYMKARFGATKAVNRTTGEIVEFPSSTAKMDTGQMSAYIDKVRDFAQEYLNTYIPEPKITNITNQKKS